MKKSNKKIPKTHLPKYKDGGFGKELENTGLFLADMALAEWAPNAITQDQYSDSGLGREYGKINSMNESFSSQSPIRKNVSKYWTDGTDSGMNAEQQKIYNDVQPLAKTGSSIGEMFTAKGLGSIGAAEGSTATGFAQNLGNLSQQGTKEYTPTMYSSKDPNYTKDLNKQRTPGLHQPTNNQFAGGGMNMLPNAEIEKQENVVAPNGGFLQADGPSHEQGGVPVALPGNSMIFSDRLKLGKKTFAELNKANNTNKEDKILESNKYGNTSKTTAELMKMAKNKNSEALFNIQESLKKAKVEAYAKRMGVTLPQEEQPAEFPMGGVKLPMYPYGGPTDNTKFTPAQKQQAYNDSLTLYKSGFNKNVPNWKTPGFNEAVGRLTELNGVAPQSTDRSATAYANDSNYLAQRSVPYAKPTVPVINADVKKSMAPTYPNVNMPMKGLERTDDFNPQLQQVPANRPNTIKTNIVTGPNMSYKEYKQGNEVLDRMYFDPQTKKEVELTGFRYGGKLPRYEFGKLTPEEEGGDIESVWNNSSAKIDAQHGWNSNDETTRPGYRHQTDWQGIGSNIAMGLANNAGNIYNLSRYNKPEIEKYERMKATYLDPTAAIRDAEMQNRRAEYNVRGASGGNAGTYLSNRVALNAQNTMNKARIRKEFENANAGISNSVNQYNNELARQEVIANAMNRARTRSGKGEAIGSMGSNIANQMMDNKKTNMDQETLGLLMKYYDTPEFQRIMKEYKGKK